ncbi:DUF6415 family natural product biosynthesis protein [Streptomyces sp. NBC_01298]|uniref:DUF6415 family natural product biosynthesis protein n=1 Tax=Streptomyces sp. NBC_01298 TaxID=2903817 RepID=UPI002E103C6A|nr:DUF6415 family natural product biosynthesis protein [Streptomyces sp. NBC_01298]
MTTQAGGNIQDLITEALGPYPHRPSAERVERLIDDLITCGHQLHHAVKYLPRNRWDPRASNAVAEWEYTSAVGPRTSEPNSNWNHARGLARIARILTAVLGDSEHPSTRLCCLCDRPILSEDYETIPGHSMSGARPDQHAHDRADPECRPTRAHDR